MSVKISQMPLLGEVSGEEVLPVVDQGGNYTVRVFDIKNFGASMFITDIVKTNAGDTAGVSPNKVNIVGSVYVVDALSTQNTNVRVYVEWDGPFNEYMGTVTVNGVTIPQGNISVAAANTRRFVGFVDVVLNGTNSNGAYYNVVTVTHSSGNEFSIPVAFASAPTVIDVNNTLPVDASELAPARTFSVTVDANKAFTTVNLQFRRADNSVIHSINSLPVTSSVLNGFHVATVNVSIPGSVAINRDTLYTFASVGDSNGFSSFTNPNNRSFVFNKYQPVVGSPAISYPASQSAIKNTEEASVTWSLGATNTSLLSGLSTATMSVTSASLNIMSYSYDDVNKTVTAVVRRGSLSLSIDTNNIALVATSSVNQYPATASNAKVDVAHTAVIVTNNGTPAVAKGGTATNIVTNFNQPVLVTSATVSASRGTITSGALPGSNVATVTRQLTVSTADILGTNVNQMVFEVTSKSGQTFTLQRDYRLTGFAPQTITFTAPQAIADLPYAISNNASVVITNAVVNSVPPLALVMNQVSGPAFLVAVEDYTLLNSPGNSPRMQINEQVLRDFYYVAGVTLTLNIEE